MGTFISNIYKIWLFLLYTSPFLSISIFLTQAKFRYHNHKHKKRSRTSTGSNLRLEVEYLLPDMRGHNSESITNNVYGAYNPLPLSRRLAQAPHTRSRSHSTSQPQTPSMSIQAKKVQTHCSKSDITNKKMRALWRLRCGDGGGSGGDGDGDGGGGPLAAGGGSTSEEMAAMAMAKAAAGLRQHNTHAVSTYVHTCAGRLATSVRAG